ncbi:MAG: NUDIX domain-containing protein [Clostridia bacterium]|nr:NUDIX domain-containing protein [Clostridia bacterium]
MPGGKQEMFETMFEGAIREVKEETNLDISNLELINATDDIGKDRHFVTLQILAKESNGELKVMEPDKEDE